MASDPENDPRVAQIAAELMPLALAIAQAVSKDAATAALAEVSHVTSAFVNAIRTNDFAAGGLALGNLIIKTVAAACESAVEGFLTHTLKLVMSRAWLGLKAWALAWFERA
jgi:hypothetical protein